MNNERNRRITISIGEYQDKLALESQYPADLRDHNLVADYKATLAKLTAMLEAT